MLNSSKVIYISRVQAIMRSTVYFICLFASFRNKRGRYNNIGIIFVIFRDIWKGSAERIIISAF
jgi:hypothetical protein